MGTAVAISGMGRIGRLLLRRSLLSGNTNFSIEAINSIYPVETVAHLLKYDTVHGKWDADILVADGRLVINGKAIEVVMERDPLKLPWTEMGIEIAVDATGQFNDRQGASRHLEAGAHAVILTAPGKGVDATFVMGVNDHLYDPNSHRLISCASCTTNCLAPVLKILDDAFTVKNGWMTTIHAYTNDQNHLDNPHKDLRRARACTESIIPTTTGVKKALADVLPHLVPMIQGLSVRVPTQDVSLLDLTVQVEQDVTAEEVKDAFLFAPRFGAGKYVEVCEEPLVSSDFVGNDKSAVIDAPSIMVFDGQIKLLAWYDNEWGYASRVFDLLSYVVRTREHALMERRLAL